MPSKLRRPVLKFLEPGSEKTAAFSACNFYQIKLLLFYLINKQ